MIADEFEYYRQYTDQNFSFMDGGATFKGTFEEFADWKDREKNLQYEQSTNRAILDANNKANEKATLERERVLQEEQNIRMRLEAEQDRQFQQSMHVLSQSMQGISQGFSSFDMRNSSTLGALGGSGYGAWSNGF